MQPEGFEGPSLNWKNHNLESAIQKSLNGKPVILAENQCLCVFSMPVWITVFSGFTYSKVNPSKFGDSSMITATNCEGIEMAFLCRRRQHQCFPDYSSHRGLWVPSAGC